jgi:hypothetical protein
VTILVAASRPASSGPTDWPPALVYFAIGLLIVAVFAVFSIYRRARRGLKDQRRR